MFPACTPEVLAPSIVPSVPEVPVAIASFAYAVERPALYEDAAAMVIARVMSS